MRNQKLTVDIWLYAPLRSPLAIAANADAVLSLDVEGRAKVTVVESVEDAGDGSDTRWRNAQRRRGALSSSVSHHHLTQCGSMYAYLLVFTGGPSLFKLRCGDMVAANHRLHVTAEPASVRYPVVSRS